MTFFTPAKTVLVLIFLASAWSFAQEANLVVLPEITVLGDSNKSSALDFVQTVDVLSGAKLERKKQTSLGQTLSHEVGVSSSFFGPNASRPVIRGMDGERIRVLNNGTGVLDASAVSQDHEVAVEPMAIDRVEIVRGPSALMYGNSAVGGVVNVITNRIPEKTIDGFNGKFDSRYSSVDGGGSSALGLNYGQGAWAFHTDGSLRSASDYHAPQFTSDKVPNSGNNTSTGALGGSYVFKDGFVGLSYARYDSTYGTVADANVKIKMKQDRYDMALESRNISWGDSVRFKTSYSDYNHQELDGDTVGTTFTNRGDESRLEVKHHIGHDIEGLWGLQSNTFDFEAIGDERFLPKTNNQSFAGFLFEEATYGLWKPSLGLRLGRSVVKANETFLDVTPTQPGEAVAGGPSARKSFLDKSASLGVQYSFSEVNALVLNLTSSERAPNDQELFANGPHMATNAYERGDPNLNLEKSQGVELSWRHKEEQTQGRFGLFLQDFHDYISQAPQSFLGVNPDTGLRSLTLYQYQAVEARFYGAEAEVTHQLPHLFPTGILEVTLQWDMVKAKDSSTGANLPRITPMRETLVLNYKANKYSADIEVQKAEKQSDIAPNETDTAGYTLVNLGVEHPLTWDVARLTAYARLNNAFDAAARNHVSVLKDLAPLPGRNFVLGLQAAF